MRHRHTAACRFDRQPDRVFDLTHDIATAADHAIPPVQCLDELRDIFKAGAKHKSNRPRGSRRDEIIKGQDQWLSAKAACDRIGDDPHSMRSRASILVAKRIGDQRHIPGAPGGLRECASGIGGDKDRRPYRAVIPVQIPTSFLASL